METQPEVGKSETNWCPACKVYCVLPNHCDNCGGRLTVAPPNKENDAPQVFKICPKCRSFSEVERTECEDCGWRRSATEADKRKAIDLLKRAIGNGRWAQDPEFMESVVIVAAAIAEERAKVWDEAIAVIKKAPHYGTYGEKACVPDHLIKALEAVKRGKE